MSDLDSRVTALEGSHEDLKNRMGVIEGDMAEIRATLGQTATKADLANAETRLTNVFQSAHVDLLKDAINSIPGKYALAIAFLTLLVMFAGLFLPRPL